MALECPTCGREVEMTVDEQCLACGDARVVRLIERLKPEERGGS